MNNCPCCSSTLLRHIRSSQIYWYCPHCKQEMPNLGDWIKAETFVNSVKKSSDQTQKPLASTSVKTPFHQQKSTLSSLILVSELTAV